MLLDSQEPSQRYCDDAWCMYLTQAARSSFGPTWLLSSHTPARHTLDLAALARTRLPGACFAELARLLLDRRDVCSDIILTQVVLHAGAALRGQGHSRARRGGSRAWRVSDDADSMSVAGADVLLNRPVAPLAFAPWRGCPAPHAASWGVGSGLQLAAC